MTIKILGSGCMNCTTLEKRTREALAQMNIVASVEKVQDIKQIMAYGVLTTPAMVIDETLIFAGRVPTLDTLKEIIMKHQSRPA